MYDYDGNITLEEAVEYINDYLYEATKEKKELTEEEKEKIKKIKKYIRNVAIVVGSIAAGILILKAIRNKSTAHDKQLTSTINNVEANIKNIGQKSIEFGQKQII